MKTKMTLAVFLLVGFLMSVTAVTSVLYFEKRFKENISLQQYALLNSLASQIDDRIFDFMAELDQLAGAISAGVVQNPDRAQRLLDAQKRQRAFFNNSLFLFSGTGKLLAANPRELNFIGKDFSFREYFQKALDTRRIYVSAPFASIQKQSHPIIMFSTPVYDAQNRIIAVLGGSIDLREQQYLRSLAAMKLGQKGFLSLYDSQRTVLMHPDRARVLRRDPQGTNEMVDRALAGFEGTAESATRAGLPVLRSVKRLKSTSWILAVSYPLRDAYAPFHTARDYFLAGSLAASFLSLFIVWPFMGYLTRPLLLFTQHLEQLPGMKEGTKRLAPINSDDEIGQMAKTFNRMLSDLEQRESALKDQKEFAESMVLSSSLPTFVIDADHKVLFWNKACEELSGVKAAEVIGTSLHGAAFSPGKEATTLADVIIDGSCDSLRSWHQVAGRSHLVKEGWHCEGWYEPFCGKRRYMFLDAAPISNDKGETVAAIETVRDLTDLKQAELDLERSRDFYLTLFENFPALIWRAGTDARANYFNKTWLDFTGRPLEQEVGDGWTAGIHPDDRQRCLGAYREAFDQRGPFQMEYRLRHRDGEYRFVVDMGRPFHDLDGNFSGYIGTCYDVTEKVHTEEQRVALEHQLTQSQKMEAIGTLTGGIAHDFNNILTAIIGYATMMQLDLAQEHPLQRKVGEILRASERASNLTRSLLAYSRKQVGNPIPVGVNSIVRNVEILLRRLIPENIDMRLKLAQEDLAIQADSGQIEQVLMNLVVNARDAMAGGGTLQIASEPIRLDRDFIAAHGYGSVGSFALLTVSDSGIGMDEKTRDRIFEPFFTTKPPGKGTGLGLAMVYAIVKQHCGFINCYSEPGHGTVFRIYIPSIDAPARAEAVAAEQAVRGGDETILLVEDDEVIREMVAELLEDFGYRVIGAVDGEDAVQKFREADGSVQMVLFDVIMPRMNGREAYHAIESISPGVKVLFMSGYTADIITETLIKGDPRHFVSKPIKINELLGKVRDLLDE